MTDPAGYGELLRTSWWGAVATLARTFGDLEAAEDAVQDACELAVRQWPVTGVPASPRAWLTGVARHKILDRFRREARRPQKEAMSQSWATASCESSGDDELALIFACCHPALDPAVRVPLTLRCVCGLATADVAAVFLLPEATMAQRLVRAKRKIRQAGIAMTVPSGVAFSERLSCVLRVIYLVFTAGHRASSGGDLVRGSLCEQALRLVRALHEQLPSEPEVTGLLALLLLVDARRAARVSPSGSLVPLADQDRTLWDEGKIAAGAELLEQALRAGRPGPYQLHAAVAACHSCDAVTDWREVAALYGELLRYEPTPVVHANRAVAVAMADGPAAGLALLDDVAPRLARWPQLHIARAELLRQLGQTEQARAAYRRALDLGLPAAEDEFISERLDGL